MSKKTIIGTFLSLLLMSSNLFADSYLLRVPVTGVTPTLQPTLQPLDLWQYNVVTTGKYTNKNTVETYIYAIDNNKATTTEPFTPFISGSTLSVTFTPKEAISAKLNIDLEIKIPGIWGHQGNYQVSCKDTNNKINYFINEKLTMQDDEYHPINITKDVKNCASITIKSTDIGKGAPYFRIYDISFS